LYNLFPSLVWDVKTSDREIYLTFDDGPHPEITPKVLNILSQYQARASFFCVGENVKKYPGVFNTIKNENHTVGNHTFNHLNGWKVNNQQYFDNIEKCNQRVYSPLFRPPYGKITPKQIKVVKKNYLIVMWSALSYDFNKNISPYECLSIAKKNTRSGTIIVFHDSEKAAENMLYALPRYLEYFITKGYQFEKLMCH